jgi:hypothetical protein
MGGWIRIALFEIFPDSKSLILLTNFSDIVYFTAKYGMWKWRNNERQLRCVCEFLHPVVRDVHYHETRLPAPWLLAVS